LESKSLLPYLLKLKEEHFTFLPGRTGGSTSEPLSTLSSLIY